jgi:hypothetical protein
MKVPRGGGRSDRLGSQSDRQPLFRARSNCPGAQSGCQQRPATGTLEAYVVGTLGHARCWQWCAAGMRAARDRDIDNLCDQRSIRGRHNEWTGGPICEQLV